MAQQTFGPAQQTPVQQPGAAPTGEDPVTRIKQLKEMLDLGVISQGEFDAKKQEILSRM
jgi:membrane protease subunit (stomatin/prohibitin family)